MRSFVEKTRALTGYVGMVKMMLTRLPDFDRWEAERGHPMLAEPKFAIDNPESMASAEKQKLALVDPVEISQPISLGRVNTAKPR